MLYTRYVKVTDIKIHEILAMHALFERYYDHGPLDTFIRDLSRKDGAFIVRHQRDDRIVGFSTMAIFDIPHQGKLVKGMFSGDTVLEKEFWGTRAVHTAYLLKLLKEALKRPLQQQYWTLISKGYKTYMVMARNLPEFYPNRRGEQPELKALVESYCEVLFPGKLDRERMVLDFGDDSNCLKGTVADIDEALRQREPDIAFFEQRNPGWDRGHELPCIAPIGLKTLLVAMVPFMAKVVRSKLAMRWGRAATAPANEAHPSPSTVQN